MFRYDAKMDGNFNRVGSNTIGTEFYPFAWSDKLNIAIGFSGQNFAWGDPDSKIVVDSLPLPAIFRARSAPQSTSFRRKACGISGWTG